MLHTMIVRSTQLRDWRSTAKSSQSHVKDFRWLHLWVILVVEEECLSHDSVVNEYRHAWKWNLHAARPLSWKISTQSSSNEPLVLKNISQSIIFPVGFMEFSSNMLVTKRALSCYIDVCSSHQNQFDADTQEGYKLECKLNIVYICRQYIPGFKYQFSA